MDEDGLGPVTFDHRHYIKIRELVYPGTNEHTEEIVDKWVYVFEGDVPLLEIYAESDDRWHCRSKANGREWETKGEIELDPGDESSESLYRFFLSPVPMTDDALTYLVDSRCLAGCVPFCIDSRPILVPDPFRWAADAHATYYIPALQQWLEWLTDEERQAKLFIAKTIEGWINNDDALGAENEMEDDQPAAFIKDHTEQEAQLRSDAENAAAYLASYVDSCEFHAVEQACMERGSCELSIAYQTWAAVLEGLRLTEPGRRLLERVVLDDRRLIGKYIFGNTTPANALSFSEYRYAWLATSAIYYEAIPQVVKSLRAKGLDPLTEVSLYLERLGIETLKGTYKRIYKQIHNQQKLTAGLSGKKKGRLLSSLKKLKRKSAGKFPSRYQEIGNSIDRLHRGSKGFFDGFKFSAGGLIEIVNLSNSISAYMEAEAGERNQKFLYLVGSSADMSIVVMDAIGTLTSAQVGKRILAGFGGVAMCISGIADMVQFVESGIQAAIGERDYGQAVGHGIAAIGAGATVVAGAMLASQAIFGGALFGGPVGLIVGVIGGVLILAGSVIAALIQRNPFEDFAAYSFLGERHGDSPIQLWWSPLSLPCQRAIDESRVLIALLSNFELKGSVESSGISIYPRYLAPGSSFEVKFVKHFWNYGPTVHRLSVHLDTDEVDQIDGPALRASSRIERNSDSGEVKRIWICTEYETDPEHPMLLQGENTEAYVRLKLSGDPHVYVPNDGKWVHIRFGFASAPRDRPYGSKQAQSLERSHFGTP